MKRVLMVLMAGLILGLLARQPQAFAQGGNVQISSEGAPTSDLPMAELQAFDHFRAEHPEIVNALSRNPKLIGSKSFQDRNPALRDFMSGHSGFEAAFAENPGNFIPPARGLGTAHHRHHAAHKAAKESAGKEASEGAAKGTGESATEGTPPTEGGSAPEGGNNSGGEAGSSGGAGSGN